MMPSDFSGPDIDTMDWVEDKESRSAFISKVFMIVFFMLSVVVILVALPFMSDDISEWYHLNWWLPLLFGCIYLVCFIALVCCSSVRRSYPINFIFLVLLAISLGVITSYLCSRYKLRIILIAFGFTLLIVGLISVIAKWGPVEKQSVNGVTNCFVIHWKKFRKRVINSLEFDVTGCGMCCFVLGLVFMLYCIVTMIISFFYHLVILHFIYCCLGLLLFTLYLLFDMQLILGGRREELGEDEYILGAVILFVDIVMIFTYLVKIVQGVTGDD